ncbi:MAG: hypothetical protein ACREJB_00885 [Planctomycetaceae bacterium]
MRFGIVAFGLLVILPAICSAEDPPKELFTGEVVLVLEALEERGIEARDELEGQVALQTSDGELVPILPDWRGRAFFQDERLRNRKVELVGYRQPGLPYLQVLSIYTFNEKGERQYTDYWCDICSIPMYEIKPCDCCQGEIRLRFQKRGLPEYLDRDANESSRNEAQGTQSGRE